MSGTAANLNNTPENFDTGKESVVIALNLEDLPGGRTLDVTGFSPAYIPAGHLIIEETATGALKPMPVSGANYGSLPSGHTYKGVLVATIETAKPFGAIMVRGTVNKNCSYYGISSVLSAVRTALPLIRFTND